MFCVLRLDNPRAVLKSIWLDSVKLANDVTYKRSGCFERSKKM